MGTVRVPQTRAVVFCDLVGSTEIRSRLGDVRADPWFESVLGALTAAVRRDDGVVVKTLGDGLMAVFPSAASALAGAVDMQRAAGDHASGAARESPILRVGVSVGDVAESDGDWNGLPVVEAARLCARAAPGEILASDTVRVLSGSRTDLGFHPVGMFDLKGLAEPVSAVRVAWRSSPQSVDRLRSMVESVPFDAIESVLVRQASTSPSDAALLLGVAAWTAAIRDDLAMASELARRAVDALDEAGTALLRPLMTAMANVIDAMRGVSPFDHAALDRLLESIGGAASATRASYESLQLLIEVPNWFTFADRYEDAARVLDWMTLEFGAPGRTVDDIAAMCCLAELEFRRGRWDRALESLASIIEASSRAGHGTGYAHSLAARIEAGRGNDEACKQHLAEAWSHRLQRGDLTTEWRVMGAEALAAATHGDWRRVWGLLMPLRERSKQGTVHLPAVRLWDGDLLEALVALNQVDEAQGFIEQLCAEHRRAPTLWAQGIIDRGLAMLAPTGAEAVVAARSSLDSFTRIGAEFEAARSGLILAERGEGFVPADELAGTLRRAELTFEALGATPWAARVRRPGSEDGGPVSSTSVGGARVVPATGFETLTPQEYEVVLSIVDGATTREAAELLSVSAKTIETHITHIYRKLNLRSRAELVAAYFRSNG